jgi:hypothetical protein
MKKPSTAATKARSELPLHIAAGRALRRAARAARETGRRSGTPLILWRDGKVVRAKA